MAVTIDKFELLPAQTPGTGQAAQAPAASAGPAGEGGAASPPLSRHEVLRAMRLEASRSARVRAD